MERENTYYIAEKASGITDWKNNHFVFRAYSSRANASKNQPLQYQFASVVANATWTDHDFGQYARGIICGLLCKYKDPVVELWLCDNGKQTPIASWNV